MAYDAEQYSTRAGADNSSREMPHVLKLTAVPQNPMVIIAAAATNKTRRDC